MTKGTRRYADTFTAEGANVAEPVRVRLPSRDEGEHFSLEMGFETERQAIAAWPRLRTQLLRDLRAKGYTTFWAPEMPTRERDTWRGQIMGGVRCLMMYIPPWQPSQWADQFATRVDTIATK